MGPLISSRLIGRVATACICALVLYAAIATSSNHQVLTGPRDSGNGSVAQPDWRDVSACNASCIESSNNRKDYNVCFTCRCLIGAAETAGEAESAFAQCLDAYVW
jgi:hypothetical protein